MNNAEKKGVLIILTGGTIGLTASKDKFQHNILEPISIDGLKTIILNDKSSNIITLREQSIEGIDIPIGFEDLRDKKKRRYHDPEELDSAQVDPTLWVQIAKCIRDNYLKYEGFVVLHGLDTMAYTSSALSFLLSNLQSPVILTGSQRPLNIPRTDATQNIYSAITLAALKSLGFKTIIPEVTVFSHDTLFRGNRVCMVHASSYRAFDSPNFSHLCSVGEHINFQSHLIRMQSKSTHLALRGDVDAKVIILDVFPGMDSGIIKSLVAKDRMKIKGVLLRTYGMGTAPTSEDVLDALNELKNSGIIVMNVTQARSGRISHGSDPVSLRLFEQGVISGVDMTAEAAYAKMVVYLSETNKSTDYIQNNLQIEECGEQSVSIFNIQYDSGSTIENEEYPDKCIATLKTENDFVGSHRLEYDLIKNIQLRILGLEPVDKEDGKPINRTIEMELSLVDPSGEPRKITTQLRTDILRWSINGRSTINTAYDVTDAKDKLLSPTMKPSTYLLIETNEKVKWKYCQFVIFAKSKDHSEG